MKRAGRGATGDESVELEGDESESEDILDAVEASEGLRCDTCEKHFSTAGKSIVRVPLGCAQLSKRTTVSNRCSQGQIEVGWSMQCRSGLVAWCGYIRWVLMELVMSVRQ